MRRLRAGLLVVGGLGVACYLQYRHRSADGHQAADVMDEAIVEAEPEAVYRAVADGALRP